MWFKRRPGRMAARAIAAASLVLLPDVSSASQAPSERGAWNELEWRVVGPLREQLPASALGAFTRRSPANRETGQIDALISSAPAVSKDQPFRGEGVIAVRTVAE